MTTATKKVKKEEVAEDIKIGFYHFYRGDEGYHVDKVCSCGHTSTAVYVNYRDSQKSHSCDICGNINFLPYSYAPHDKRTAVPVVYDVESSDRGFDLKKTNLSVVFDHTNKKIEIIKSNLVRRYVFDWVDNKLIVYRNGEKEIDMFEEDNGMNYYEAEKVYNRVANHLNRGMGDDNKSFLEKVDLKNMEFYKSLNIREGDVGGSRRGGVFGMLYRALQKKEKYNWVQVLGAAGYKDIRYSINAGWYSEPLIDKGETKPHKILGVSKKVAKYVKESGYLGDYRLRKVQDVIKDGRKMSVLTSIMESITDKTSFAEVIESLEDLEWLVLNKQYQASRLTEYIFNEIHLYQGISDPRSGVELLRDYVSMSSKMQIPFEKYPKSLKREHDVTMINYQVFAKENKSKLFLNTMQENDYLKDDSSDKDYCVVLPDTPQDLVVEGGKLNHCVGSYVDRVENGETVIAFLRDKKEKEAPLVTIEVKDWVVKQARGAHNRSITETEREYLDKWAENRQLVLSV